MTIDDLIEIYKKKKKRYGTQAYRQISTVFKEAKEQHKKDFRGTDHEQSWRSFKGNNLEKLIEYIITDEVHGLGLKAINSNALKRTNKSNLSEDLGQVKKNLLIDYGEFGYHLPDVDIVIYDPKTNKIIAALSVKVTLRERIAQTGYWKMKLQNQSLTRHIKFYFITLDEDGVLMIRKPAKKGRAIVEADTDGSYVLNESDIENSDKVKMFDRFIDDLKGLLK